LGRIKDETFGTEIRADEASLSINGQAPQPLSLTSLLPEAVNAEGITSIRLTYSVTSGTNG
jgi:hypothetical protein